LFSLVTLWAADPNRRQPSPEVSRVVSQTRTFLQRGDFLAQEIERGVRELSACGVASVVRDVLVHEAPKRKKDDGLAEACLIAVAGMLRSYDFPKAVALGENTLAWDLAEVEAWVASRPRRAPKTGAKKPSAEVAPSFAARHNFIKKPFVCGGAFVIISGE
jgi:Prophage CP4-57 regulatory protein (AlpA)